MRRESHNVRASSAPSINHGERSKYDATRQEYGKRELKPLMSLHEAARIMRVSNDTAREIEKEAITKLRRGILAILLP